jgi:ribosomal-protein-alanine N-acetyltransferase
MLRLNFEPFPTLHTERLTLGRLTASDAAALFILRADKSVNRYLDREPATSEAAAIAFISKIEIAIAKNESIYWVMRLRQQATLIGTICYWNFDSSAETAEIGYELMPEYQGKGFMREALSAVITYGFDELKLRTIAAYCHTHNKPSIQLLQNNNFVEYKPGDGEFAATEHEMVFVRHKEPNVH